MSGGDPHSPVTVDEKIAFFFAPPLPAQPLGTNSSLHLLRREAQDCLIGTVLNEDEVIAQALREPHRLFATLMVVMAGVDLLAKFYAGSDDIGQVKARIKGFASRFMFPSAKDPERCAEILYLGLRNPLLHSFTLYDRKLQIWLVTRHPQLDIVPNPADPDHFIVSIEGLYAAFVRAVVAYHSELASSDSLRVKFEVMFERYGRTGFGALPVR